MEQDAAVKKYIEAILPEQEAFLYQRARNKVRSITERMTEEEASAYYDSKAFDHVFFQVKRSDKVYQGLLRGELLFGPHQSELERLTPLLRKMPDDAPSLDLPFLRSVESSHVSLSGARAALDILARQKPRRLLQERKSTFIAEAEKAVTRYLLAFNPAESFRMEEKTPEVIPFLLENAFAGGIPAEMVDRAYAPSSLSRNLLGELYHAFPVCSACRRVLTPSGETVSACLEQTAASFRQTICSSVHHRFPRERIRGLLRKNPSVRELQRQKDAALSAERNLQSALLHAVPEHYRDLYPLARRIHRHFFLHLGPTNSGKTYEGVLRLHSARKGIYLGPLRLLAAEQFETLNLSGIPCSLITGEEQIRVEGSHVQSSTVEMADLKTHYDIAVIDECQMITDRDRGGAWTDAILGLCADEIHACASPDAEALLVQIISECGDEITILRHERMVPLVVESEGFQFPESVRSGDALIVFSKARVHAVAAELKQRGFHVSLIYGALPPDVRRDQAERFHLGETDVVVSTDAIAMGMNLPIERVVFLENEKYDGDIVRPLSVSEIKQIAGRAGRYGQYDVGYVNAFGFKGTVAQALGRPFYPLTEAVIRFPDSLLGIPLPLTEIINKWLAMKDKSYFSKASTARMAALAAMLENRHTDKHLLYRFLCIPFDETEQDLLSRWRAMYHAECTGTHMDVLAELPAPVNPEDCTIQMLGRLEAAYRCCDLYYNYARVFLPDPEPVLDEIGQRKSLISKGIIHILSTQKLEVRTCPACGARLPWNWPYRYCDSCHRHHAGSRGRKGFPDPDDYWD